MWNKHGNLECSIYIYTKTPACLCIYITNYKLSGAHIVRSKWELDLAIVNIGYWNAKH